MSDSIKLTQYSHGAGCGCKISPAVLDEILAGVGKQANFPALLVGNDTRDDAAVYDLGNGTAMVSTTDFFMPIVDDPQEFGRIASVNAISDIYAMGGSPLMAIAILGWPINTLSAEVAGQVLEGARMACAEAGIPLSGGHSIDSPEPIFGLAVSGLVSIQHLKKNSGAEEGAKLYLTKALGVGILTTAQKKGLLQDAHARIAPESMMKLNNIGQWLGSLPYVQAMTDVTGFGLMGHLSEMCQGSGLSAEVQFEKVPVLDPEVIHHYLDKGCVPGGTNRNHASYGHLISPISERQKAILCDPQTSGGLLLAIDKDRTKEFEELMEKEGYVVHAFGQMVPKGNYVIEVQ